MKLLAKTTCPYCGVGCGVEVRGAGDQFTVTGDPSHPANRGRLCIKGSTLGETLIDRDRLLYPHIQGQQVAWSEAISTVAGRIRECIDNYGPQSVAFYLSGQLLTEDYYVANKFIKGFVGSPNVDTNSRLCMSSAVAAQKRAFGEDLVTGCYEDLELCDLVVFVGSNAAWTHPVLFQRIVASQETNPSKRLVVIDPRKTDTVELADLHLQIRPGTDLYLFTALFRYLHEKGKLDPDVMLADNFERTLDGCPLDDLETVAERCGVEGTSLRQFFDWFASTPRTVTFYSQGINQSASGTDNGNAIINCHVGTGRLGKPGASAFSVTGQPNAMGGREVGGLANQLAAHMDYSSAADIDRVGRYWDAPSIPGREGLKTVDLFRAVEDGQIQFLWIMATNPLVSLPDAARWEAALRDCGTVVVSDCMANTDTARVADILLPAAAWGEKDGTVTNSERRISRQRAFLPPPGETKPDWQIVTDVAREMGFGENFGYDCARDVFVEHAALTAFENEGDRVFDIGGLATLTRAGYDDLKPIQWPVNDTNKSGRARVEATGQLVPLVPAGLAGAEGFVLNTGRLRDQWHTMTRTGQAPTLLQHQAEPMVDVNPGDARRHGIGNGDVVELRNNGRFVLMRANVTDAIRAGELFAPIHFSDTHASNACVDDLVPAVTDPISGQPALKHARVSLHKRETASYGLLVTDTRLRLDRKEYWVELPVAGGFVYFLAGQSRSQIECRLRSRFGEPAQVLKMKDQLRLAFRDANTLRAAWFWSTRPIAEAPWWLAERLGRQLDSDEWAGVLFGSALAGGKAGRVICSCFQVTDREIDCAIASGAASTSALGEALSCGTNCGSCVPELNRRLRESAG